MDTKQLITEAKARFNHNSAKAYLKDKYESKLSVADQGGLWVATIELISFLSTNAQSHVVLPDSYGNPVKVNRADLLTKLDKTYTYVMEQWYSEWAALEKKR
jgi:hypothetical protein